MKADASKKEFASVEAYIKAQPAAVRPMLAEMRALVLAAAPGATEVISYSMPAVKYEKMLVWYAVFKKHIGFYPKTAAIEAFAARLKPYKTSKGAVQFPLDQALPAGLIKDMVKYARKLYV